MQVGTDWRTTSKIVPVVKMADELAMEAEKAIEIVNLFDMLVDGHANMMTFLHCLCPKLMEALGSPRKHVEQQVSHWQKILRSWFQWGALGTFWMVEGEGEELNWRISYFYFCCLGDT